MGVRQWMKRRLADDDSGDVPPGSSLFTTLFGADPAPIRSLGEFSASTYPPELAEQVRRRQQVAGQLLTLDVTRPEARAAAIPKLQELLSIYPHPLVYETLIHAFVEAGRFEDAKGVAFAARERRIECARSPYPEIQSEVDFLHEWTPEEVDRLRTDLEAKRTPA